MTKSIFLKRLSATVQFILGFVLGVSLIAGISGAALFAYYKKMSILPKKPVFPRTTVPQTASNPKEPSTTIEPLESTTVEAEVEEPQAALEEPEPQPAAESELPPDAYRAVVTWPQGLSLRAEPSTNADKVGGIEANTDIIILEDSADGNWQKVRLPLSNQEGWVKGGNTERTSD